MLLQHNIDTYTVHIQYMLLFNSHRDMEISIVSYVKSLLQSHLQLYHYNNFQIIIHVNCSAASFKFAVFFTPTSHCAKILQCFALFMALLSMYIWQLLLAVKTYQGHNHDCGAASQYDAVDTYHIANKQTILILCTTSLRSS